VVAELSAITARYQSQIPRFYYNPAQPSRITATPLHEKLTGRSRPALLALVLSVGLLLLIASVNVANLQLARAAARRREIGLRMALGAQSGDVLRMLLRRCLVLTVAGVTIGAGIALYLVRYLQSLVFGVEPRDAVSFGGAGFVLLLVAVAAGYLPAHRAARIDPAVTLRSE
jgi:ABC-type antimicrobial peptide transport system permease subunit